MATVKIRDIRSRQESQTRSVVIEFLYVLIGVAPGILWLLYFFIVNRKEDNSFESIARVFVWAAAFTIPTAILEHILVASVHMETLQESMISSFFMIAPIEEFFKLLAVWIGAYRRADFRSPMDGLTYAVTAALGFVAVENALYIIRLGPTIVWMRLLYATPGHILFSSLWGYSLGIARFVPSGEFLIILKGFFLSAAFHGLYNFLVALEPSKTRFYLVPLLAVLLIVAVTLVRKLYRSSPYEDLGEWLLVACPNCDAYAPQSSIVCARCGASLANLEPDSPRFCWKCRHQVAVDATRCPRCYVRLRKTAPSGNATTALNEEAAKV
ncbi:MAG: PrsW family glutamic-type intramembrane protease [Pseudomonadota bacterium]